MSTESEPDVQVVHHAGVVSQCNGIMVVHGARHRCDITKCASRISPGMEDRGLDIRRGNQHKLGCRDHTFVGRPGNEVDGMFQRAPGTRLS